MAYNEDELKSTVLKLEIKRAVAQLLADNGINRTTIKEMFCEMMKAKADNTLKLSLVDEEMRSYIQQAIKQIIKDAIKEEVRYQLRDRYQFDVFVNFTDYKKENDK